MIGRGGLPFGLALGQLRLGQLYVKSPDDGVDFDGIPILQQGDRSAMAASGPTWPMQNPRVAPENRPSVINAILPPMPCPVSAAVVESISRIPGPPRGPS